MKKIFINIFIVFLIFQNILFNFFKLPSFFNYWDEITTILIMLYSIIYSSNKKIKKEYFQIFLLMFFIVLFGVLGNLMFEHVTSFGGIFRDIINFLKFPLTLTLLFYTNIHKTIKKSLSKKTINFLKFIIVIMFVLGIISLFKDIGLSQNEIRSGIKPYQFLFNHPTSLVICCIFILSIFESYDDKKSIFLYRMMILIIIFLTMRTKGMMVISVYVFIKYFGPKLKNLKFLYWGIAFIVAFAMAYDKLVLYNSFTTSPREVLYKGSLTLLIKYFPFGSGFASFASHISANYNSTVYNIVKIPKYYLTIENGLVVLGDAGFPYYIGQFGFIGMILIIIVGYKIYNISVKKCIDKLPMTLIYMYILIALTSESTLLNFGIETAFIAALVSALSNKENVT